MSAGGQGPGLNHRQADGSTLLPGDSAEQREAEAIILAALARELDVPLLVKRFPLDGGVQVTVDGASADPPILVEVWARQGPPKSAQKARVVTDARWPAAWGPNRPRST